ncbi:DUF4249 domain-containing protein [Spirosoma jeollabukense]
MKNKIYKQALGWLMIALVGGCVDPYRPPEIASPDSYLVVNGFFDSAPGNTTTIQLSRTQNLTDPKAPTAETRAKVTIESAHNASYALTEATGGLYTLSGVTPLSSETYRLHIKTAKGLDYYSDYVPVVTTPPIDSVGWYVDNEGVHVHVNTHDPNNNTHYYRWEFDETWEYTSAFYSSYVYDPKTRNILNRTEDIYHCWGSATSKNIILSSTARLSKDIVNKFPLTTVTGSSLKLQSKYSILVRQYALSQAGYDYYDQLAKLTQSIGSIFDPQPTQITGNFHSSTNPGDLVLGFFRVGTVTSKRIFIKRAQLPQLAVTTGYEACYTQVDTLSLAEIRDKQPGIITLFEPGTYLTNPIDCLDCRMRGGVTTKPAFWE